MKDKILIIVNQNQIVISNNGKRMIIDKKDSLFDKLKDKTKEEIKEWFVNRK